MTSEPRRDPPKVLEDLLDRHYSVLATVANIKSYRNKDQLHKRFV